ncbi:hypothetical protein, partial [Vreelandella sulfidaeris]
FVGAVDVARSVFEFNADRRGGGIDHAVIGGGVAVTGRVSDRGGDAEGGVACVDIGDRDVDAVIQIRLGNGTVKEFVALAVGNHQGVAHRGARTERDRGVNTVADFVSAVDVARGVFKRHTDRRGGGVDHAVIGGGVAVTGRVSDRGGDAERRVARLKVGDRDGDTVIQIRLGDGTVKELIALAVGDHQGVAHRSARTERDRGVNAVADFVGAVDVARGVFKRNADRRGGGVDHAVIGGGVAVTGRVGDRGGDAEGGVACVDIGDRDGDTVIQIRLGNWAVKEFVALAVGDHQGIAHCGARAERDRGIDAVADFVSAVDVATGVFKRNADCRGGGIDHAVIGGGVAVTGRVGDRGGDAEGRVASIDIGNCNADTVIQIRLGD